MSIWAMLSSETAAANRLPVVRHSSVVVAASNDVDFQGIDGADGAPGSDYTSVFAMAAFAAQYFNQFTVDIPFLLKARADCTPAAAALCPVLPFKSDRNRGSRKQHVAIAW